MKRIWLCCICGMEYNDADDSYSAYPIDKTSKCCEKCFNKYIAKTYTSEYIDSADND